MPQRSINQARPSRRHRCRGKKFLHLFSKEKKKQRLIFETRSKSRFLVGCAWRCLRAWPMIQAPLSSINAKRLYIWNI